jgi:hypothetical protein
MAAKAENPTCRQCKTVKVSQLVYKDGALRRKRVLQCPNHCDLKCPQCDETLRVTSTRPKEKSLKCVNCLWNGHSPDRKFLVAQKKFLENQRSTNIPERAVIDLRVGSNCSHCGHGVLVAERVERVQISGSEIKITLSCDNSSCGETFWEQIIDMSEKQLITSNRRVFPGISVCPSCELPIRSDSRCGCS